MELAVSTTSRTFTAKRVEAFFTEESERIVVVSESVTRLIHKDGLAAEVVNRSAQGSLEGWIDATRSIAKIRA